jgi:tetratricopeptide (TPR) repeat protein
MDILREFSDPERISARLAFHRRVIAEEEAAKAICDRALTGPSSWWHNALTKDDGGRTAGMVEVLMERSGQVLARSPLDGLAIAEIAVAIANDIECQEYPYDHVFKIRGQALRCKAFVLSYLGRLREAEEAADNAEHYLKQIPVPPFELARLDLVRSNIARNMGKYPQAIAAARRAAENFLWFGDREGWLKAVDFEASALFSSHDYRAALEVWRSMDRYAHLLTDEARAAHLHNLGLCASESGEFDEAARSYALAAEAFDHLGLPVNRVKCRASLGMALHHAARHEEAIVLLQQVWEELDTLGMEGDGTFFALLLAESLLITGRTGDVPKISRLLLDRCSRAGMTAGAMTALAFLRETVASGHVTPVLVRHVREFVKDTNMGLERHFEPVPRGDA